MLYDRDKNGNPFIKTAPFAVKSLPEGKLFRRVHGVEVTLNASGDTNIDLIVPYTKAKINKIKMLWFPEGVNCDLKIHDSESCVYQTLTGVPVESRISFLELNQFAFGAGVAKDVDEDHSEYDADLIGGMRIRMIVHNPTTTTKQIRVNFVLHEVV